MKISIKITQSQAEVLAIYSSVGGITAFGRRQRVLLSLMREIAEKIRRFYHGFRSNVKSKKITFKWYEADTLELFLNERMPYISDEYDKTTLLYIIGEINQQLA
ncbi:hypothetical protein [Capnocytophaga canimorsus]|uniref:hypothetical protein n=1 Tax=Capnocytophaga canimorsus TaxID=28188 RepID=UPI0037CD405D